MLLTQLSTLGMIALVAAGDVVGMPQRVGNVVSRLFFFRVVPFSLFKGRVGGSVYAFGRRPFNVIQAEMEQGNRQGHARDEEAC